MNQLELRAVNKSFGSLQAVGDVSLAVRQGEIFGIAGPNGAGKTTLFNLITGIPFRADGGEILLEGRPIQDLPAHAICHAGIARTFQTEAAFNDLTVAENVRIGAVYGRRAPNVSDSIEQALDALEITHLRNDLAGSLPLYEKKRLMLASAIAANPLILMLDEPAAGLNQVEYTQLATLIRSLNAAGTTVVLIEHVLPLLLSVSNRVLIMNSGRVIAEGEPDEVVRRDEVITAYLGERGRRIAHAQH